MNDRQRKIIHVDMDCFYAAVETRDDPSLKGVPLAVGGSPTGRGVIATCNYEARAFGIHSAMATAYAIRLCPHLHIIRPRMAHYVEISKQIRAIFSRYTDVIEPLSLDEAFLDVSNSSILDGSATRIAMAIRHAIRSELQLTASAGVAPNKFLAKVASDENKPDGLCVVTPDKVVQFVRDLPLKKIPGVGKVTLERLEQHGLRTCADVRAMGEKELVLRFGGFGQTLFRRARGIDDRELVTHWVRKSLSVEHTFSEDIPDPESAIEALDSLYLELSRRLAKSGTRPIRNQQIKLKFSDFRVTTMERHSVKLDKATFEELMPLAWERGAGKGIRLLGIGVAFRDEDDPVVLNQLTLF